MYMYTLYSDLAMMAYSSSYSHCKKKIEDGEYNTLVLTVSQNIHVLFLYIHVSFITLLHVYQGK